MKILLTFIVLIGLIGSTNFLSADEESSDTNTITFDVRDANNNMYHIVDKQDGLDIDKLRGKVVFLAFFGHRCPPCMMEVPGFINFTNDKEYAKKAVILAFEVQGLSRSGLKSFLQYKGINYNVVPGMQYKKFIDYIGYRTQWNFGIPYMVVLDTTGKVVNYGNGIVSEEELKELADQLYVESNSTISQEESPNSKEDNKTNAMDAIIDMISGKNKH